MFNSLLPAQEYLLDVSYYGIEDGLSQRDVECIQQDKKGFIWMGTNYGLNRFDGYQFKWFTKEKHGLQSNTINHILQDDEGWLWLFYTRFRVSQTPESIDLFNPVTEEVLSLEEKFGEALPFKLSDVTSFTASPEGRLAFVTTQKKLVLYSQERGFEVSDLNVYPVQLGLFSQHNTIWGYAFKDDPALKDIIVEIGVDGKERRRYEHTFPYQYNYIAAVDQDDKLWYVSKYWYNGRFDKNQRAKIYTIDRQGTEREFSLENTTLPLGTINLDIPETVDMYGYRMNPYQGTFWLFGKHGFQGFHLTSGWHKELGTAHKELIHPNTVYFDAQGRTWVGTEFGVYLINLTKNPFLSIAHDSTEQNTSTFRGITEDYQRTLWACIDNGFGWLGRFQPKGDHYESKTTDWERKDWGGGYKYGIFTDSKGLVWFGSGHDSLIARYNPVDHSFRQFPYFIPRKAADQQVNIWSFFEDDKGQIWFGTDAGVIGYVGSEQVATLPELKDVSEQGGCIYQFHPDQKGNIWLATDDGMYQLDLKNRLIRPFRSKDFPFLEEGIFHIHQDAADSYWLGTKGLGLIHWQPGTGIYQQYTKADGLSNNTIYAVYEDDFGNLWLPSDYGIIQFNKSTHRARAYLEKDGIANQEFNRISHYKSRDGKLYFGGLNGITTFHPKNLAGDSLSSNIPLVLTGFQQFDGDANQLIDKTAALRQSNTIRLNPDDRFFRVEFALLTYSDVGNIQYAYLIEGVDKDWTYQKENSVRFSHLPYGRHRLRIKGQASNGQWSSNEMAIRLVVLKPFYLQAWFLIAAVLVIGASAFSFYQWRLRSFEAQRDELERVVVERTRQISKDKAIIEQQAEELKSLEKLKSRFFANFSHELRTPLTLILGPINLLLNQTDQQGKDRKLLSFIQRNAQQLQKLINEILDLSKLEDNKMEVVEEPVHFYPYLKQQMAQFHSAAISNELGFDLKFRTDKSLQILLDKGKFEKIIHNFLSNAMKFTPKNGRIILLVEEADGQLQLKVVDNGQGIHPDDIPHIFDRFYQSQQPDASTGGGTGIGLSLVKELAELLGGMVWVESELGKGSTFYFRFPKKITRIENGEWRMENGEWRGENGPSASIQPGIAEEAPILPSPFSLLPSPSSILIVEDNPDLREYLQILLSDYHVITAENGKEALELLTVDGRRETGDGSHDARPPDLIISDLMMPVMDGFQFLEKLKSDDRWRHLPVIMLTAKINMRAKLAALRIGVDDYLTKPFQQDELKARIENLLRNYRERMEMFSQTQMAAVAEPAKPIIATVDVEWLKEVEAVFIAHLSDSRLTVEFAAGKLNLSERQFHRRIKEVTGLTPNQYLQEVRLQQAKELLHEGRFATIKETAYAVGFTDARYFSNLFEQHFGAKPSDARR